MENEKEIENLLKDFRLLKDDGIGEELCIDPIIPYINDDLHDLGELIAAAAEAGARSVRANFLVIPYPEKEKIIKGISRLYPDAEMYIRNIYSVRIGERLFPEREYSERFIEMLAAVCKKAGVKFCPHGEPTGGERKRKRR
jgi:DNA repair photolyase